MANFSLKSFQIAINVFLKAFIELFFPLKGFSFIKDFLYGDEDECWMNEWNMKLFCLTYGRRKFGGDDEDGSK